MRKFFYKLYRKLIMAEVMLRSFFFGFENVNNRLQTVEKGLIQPILKKFGAEIGSNCDIESPITINAKGNYKNLKIRNNVYIGKKCLVDLKGEVTIQDNVVISMGSTIISHMDLGLNNQLNIKYPQTHYKTIIGKNCYLGANSIVLGVELGENIVVAAGSVVTKSFPSNSLVGGVPAKLIRKIEI